MPAKAIITEGLRFRTSAGPYRFVRPERQHQPGQRAHLLPVAAPQCRLQGGGAGAYLAIYRLGSLADTFGFNPAAALFACARTAIRP
jgi:hypothetical protein